MWRRTLNLPTLRHHHISEMIPLIAMLPEKANVAEIGCFSGECSIQFVMSPKVAFLLCVDQWKGGYDETGDDVASKADMRAVRRAFEIRMGISRKHSVFCGASLQAAKTVQDGVFDLVYIDADHSYEAVVADIKTWAPKVKQGGLLAGHDWCDTLPAVREAVQDELGNPAIILPDTSWVKRL